MSVPYRNSKPREVIAALKKDGYYVFRNGPGDHIQFKHPTKPGKVTVDPGVTDIPIKTLKSIYKQAHWKW